MKDRIKNEPVLIRAGVTIVATLLAVFGLDADPEVLAAVITLAVVLMGVDVRRVTVAQAQAPEVLPTSFSGDVDLEWALAPLSADTEDAVAGMGEVAQTVEGAI